MPDAGAAGVDVAPMRWQVSFKCEASISTLKDVDADFIAAVGFLIGLQ